MKYFTLVLGLCLALLTSSCKAPSNSINNKIGQKELRQVGLFKFKKEVSADSIKAMQSVFIEITNQIKEVKKAELGLNIDSGNLSEGFTHCFITTFASEQDRAIYSTHPYHQTFKKKFSPLVDKVCITAFWSDIAK